MRVEKIKENLNNCNSYLGKKRDKDMKLEDYFSPLSYDKKMHHKSNSSHYTTSIFNSLNNALKSSENKYESNSSSDSGYYGFQSELNENDITIEFKFIGGRSEFIKNISKINSPCFCNIKKIKINDANDNISIQQNKKKKIKILNSSFDELKEDDINFVDLELIRNKLLKDKNEKLIFFSSSVLKACDHIDKSQFIKAHDYLTKFSNKSLISDFCYDKNLYFPFAGNNYYIGYDRLYSHIFRIHHFHDEELGKIIYNFGPKGTGKSLCGRATIFNYFTTELVRNQEVFFPAIFFDIKIWINNWNNKTLLLKILKYEFMNLFKAFQEWKIIYSEFVNEFNKSQYSSVFELILYFINFYFSKQNFKLLIIIDHYSSLYDKNNEIQNIEKMCSLNKNLDIFFNYEINTIEDQKVFINYLGIMYSVMNSISREEDESNQINLTKEKVACFHGYELRGLSSIKKTIENQKEKELEKNSEVSELLLIIEKNMQNIPKDYEQYFGENSSFYFKYLSIKETNNLDFKNFVEKEKFNIKDNIINFLRSDNSIPQNDLYSILKKIVKNENKELDELKDLESPYNYLNYIDSSYFLFQRIKNNNSIKYKYTYAFPLIKDIFEELIKLYDKTFFIDINDKEFEKLDGITMGNIFDKFINYLIKKQINKSGFMEFSSIDIESFDVDYLIKKNYKNIKITEMCSREFVEKEIKAKDKLIKLKLLGEKKNVKNKKCIIIFQDFNAKSIDICFLIKRNKNTDNFSINSLQMKCNNSFNIDDELLRNNRYEMTYLKYKFEKLFDIKIIESYITYLSIFDIPKKCTLKNRDKFFYYKREDKTFVDMLENKIEQFPFYDSCKINFVDIDDYLSLIRNIISFIDDDLIFSLDETDKEIVINYEKQINNSVIIEINKDIINIHLIFEKKNYDLEKKNKRKIENHTYYFIIQFYK